MNDAPNADQPRSNALNHAPGEANAMAETEHSPPKTLTVERQTAPQHLAQDDLSLDKEKDEHQFSMRRRNVILYGSLTLIVLGFIGAFVLLLRDTTESLQQFSTHLITLIVGAAVASLWPSSNDGMKG